MSNKSKHKRETRAKNQEMQIIMAYYRNHPIEFIESHLNIELNQYQKFMIGLAFKFKRFNKFKEVDNG